MGVCRYRGPIAVGELMHFFDATHESINDLARASKLKSASLSRPSKRIKTEAAMPPVSPTTRTARTQHQNAQQDQVQAKSAHKHACTGLYSLSAYPKPAKTNVVAVAFTIFQIKKCACGIAGST